MVINEASLEDIHLNNDSLDVWQNDLNGRWGVRSDSCQAMISQQWADKA